MKTSKNTKKKRNIKTIKINGTKPKIYSKNDFKSGDGMLTSVWGPSMWHYLHTMSFNYPVNPSKSDKNHYKKFILSLQHVLPCKYCRINLKKNFKILSLTNNDMVDRDKFSRYIYNLHETVNKMLGKQSGLSYCDVRERYEHFRSRCTLDKPKILVKKHVSKTKKNKKESGCTEPLYGKKSKCILKIVPQEKKEKTFQMDKNCIKIR